MHVVKTVPAKRSTDSNTNRPVVLLRNYPEEWQLAKKPSNSEEPIESTARSSLVGSQPIESAGGSSLAGAQPMESAGRSSLVGTQPTSTGKNSLVGNLPIKIDDDFSLAKRLYDLGFDVYTANVPNSECLITDAHQFWNNS